MRDERLRAQTAREEATLRGMRLVTGAAEAERRTAEIELREVQERLRRARQGDEADVYAVLDGPEVAMSYVPEGGGGGRFGVVREEATGEPRTRSKGTGLATVLGNEVATVGSRGERGSIQGTPGQEAEAEVEVAGEVGGEAKARRARQVEG